MPIANSRPVLTGPVETGMPGISPEFELLLNSCARRFKVGEGLLARPYQWKQLINLAQQHGLIPQLYSFLARYREQVPSQDFAVLRSKYEENVRKALWFGAELVRILGHLEEHGIKAMPYKGPALAQMLYGDVTRRQFGDLDILVFPKDVMAAKDALLALGYMLDIRLKAREERAYLSTGYEFPFAGADGPHLVELQWRILPRFYSVDFDIADLFKRAEQVSLGGRLFSTLGLDDLLLVLCVHAAKHVWVQLSWLREIAELAESPRIDWDFVWEGASTLGIQRIVALNFLLAQDLLGLALPDPIQGWLEKDCVCQILKADLLRIITGGLHYDTESLAYFRLMIRLRERGSDKARFLWRLICTPGIGEWSAVPLPARLSALYYIVRLGRLATKVIDRYAEATHSDAHESSALS